MRGKTLPYMSFKSSKTTAPKTELSVDLTGVWAKAGILGLMMGLEFI